MKIAIAGAGSIGCYVGGMLQADGQDVVFFGRPSMAERLANNGLRVQTMSGVERTISAGNLDFQTTAQCVSGASHVLVCVKSMASEEMAIALRDHLSPDAVVISLQNGLDNAATLQAAVPGHTVHAGMVSFNVVQKGVNQFAATTEGGIHLQDSPPCATLRDALAKSGIDCELHRDMAAVLWSKLLLNLNNALNALSGKPLAEQLRDRRWRKILASCVREGLAVAKAQGITPVRIGKVKPQIIPFVLRLPDLLFERVASQMLKIDPQARSSMADDLASGRPPEIYYLNGTIVARGKTAGVATPVNSRVCEAVERLFAGKIETPVAPNTF